MPFEDPYRSLVDSVRDYALLLLDAKGHVKTWNPGAEAIKQYTAEEILGKHFSIFYPTEERATRPAKELEIASTRGRYEEEGWRVRKDGTRFWANVVLTPVRNDRGEIVGFAKVTRDLTERMLAARKLEESQQTILALSSPVIRLWPGILLLPIVGDVDTTRAETIMETLLDRVIAEQAKIVIVDVAGLPAMGTQVADMLIKTTAALRLVGAKAIISGIGPRVSRTMVRLGIDVRDVITKNQLAGGVEVALSILGMKIEAPRS